MTTKLSAEQVWREVEQETFAVLGMVTAAGEARTVGVSYIVQGRKFYINSAREAWKVQHVAANPAVSMTIAIPKRIRFMPKTKLPPATISLHGTGRVLDPNELPVELVAASLGFDIAQDPERLALVALIEVTPVGEFVTYGVGVSLSEMGDPSIAKGRAPVE